MSGFGSGWGGNAQLFWAAPPPSGDGPLLGVEFPAPAAGNFEVELHHTLAPDFGRFQVFVNHLPVGEIDGYGTEVRTAGASLGVRALQGGMNLLEVRVVGKSAASSGFFVGLDRLVLTPVSAPSDPAGDTPAAGPGAADQAPLPPWTTQDIIDPRIDVAAQYGLMRLLAGEPEERLVGSHILSAIKSGLLGGIYQEDQQVPALRAQAAGYGWWQILPKLPNGQKADSKCMTDPPTKAPILVMRKKAEANPAAYDKALVDAWYQCGLPGSLPRPYAKTLPQKQPSAKAGRCASPLAQTELVVGVLVQMSAAPDSWSLYAGASVEVTAAGGAPMTSTTDAAGTAVFQLPNPGLYLVYVGNLPPGHNSATRTVEVLGHCMNHAHFEFARETLSEGCQNRARQCKESIQEGNAQCNVAFVEAMKGCAGDTSCEEWAEGHYGACLAALTDELETCRSSYVDAAGTVTLCEPLVIESSQ